MGYLIEQYHIKYAIIISKAGSCVTPGMLIGSNTIWPVELEV